MHNLDFLYTKNHVKRAKFLLGGKDQGELVSLGKVIFALSEDLGQFYVQLLNLMRTGTNLEYLAILSPL